MHFNGFISDYLELVFLLKSFWIFIEKEDGQLSRYEYDSDIPVVDIYIKYYLHFIFTYIFCFNLISIAVCVNWYQLLAKHGICSEYQPQRFHAITNGVNV